jgi:hypothetical protein
MEPNPQGIGKMLLIGGGLLALVGLLFMLSPKIPFLGRLPWRHRGEAGEIFFLFPPHDQHSPQPVALPGAVAGAEVQLTDH